MSDNVVLFLTGDGAEWATSNGVVFSTGIPYSLQLVTDRTQADVDRLEQLRTKDFASLTDEEKAELLADLKGAYNFNDLNRVEKAALFVANALAALPGDLRAHADSLSLAWDAVFNVPYDAKNYKDLPVRISWEKNEIPGRQDLARYLNNIVLIRDAFAGVYPTLPASMQKLTYAGANAIERVLELAFQAAENHRETVKKKMDNSAATWFYSGDLFGGEL